MNPHPIEKLIEVLKEKQHISPSYIVKGVFQDAINTAEEIMKIDKNKSNEKSPTSSTISRAKR